MLFQVPDPTELPEIVVTAARLPPAAAEAAFSVTRLTQADIAHERRVDEALATVPAVSLFRRTSSQSANPTTQGISLRAIAPSGAGRTLVTLDGVPQNDSFGGWVIWSQLATEDLSSLDVVRGAGSGPYGAGALTGVIQMRERDSGRVVDVSVLEHGGTRLAGAGRFQLGPVPLVISAVREVSDGYIPVRGAGSGAADTPLDIDVLAGSLRFDIPVGSATVSVRASAVEDDRGSGLAGARATARANAQSFTAARAPVEGHAGWRVQLWRRQSDLANSSVAVAADRQSTTPANDQYETPTTGWGGNVALRHQTTFEVGQLESEMGADARVSDGETHERFRYMGGSFTRDRVAGGRSSVAGVYADASLRSGHWLAVGGVRWDHWRNQDGKRVERDRVSGLLTLDETDPTVSGQVASARLALRRELGTQQAVRIAAYSGFRPATLNELHRPFRVGNDLTEANPGLTPETLVGLEAGWSWNTSDTSITATAFWNRVEDAIVNVTIGQGPGTFPRAGFVPAGGVLRQRQNAGSIDARGLEVDARARLTDRMQLRMAVSATDARMDGGSTAPQLTGLRPAQAPIWSAVAGLDWQISDPLSLQADLRWESRRFEDDLNSRELASSATLDLRTNWQLTPSATLSLFAINALDTETEVSRTGNGVAGYGSPRTIGLAIRWSNQP